MDKDPQHPFRGIATVTPPREIYNNILFRVDRDRMRAARIRLALFGAMSFVSFIALFPALQYAARGFYQSGSYEYLSLLFSDGTALLPYWKEFFFTILESMPVFEMATALTVVYVLLESVKLAIRNTSVAFHLKTN
ncbi:MAG: hypothetical protein WC878_04280 [Candidatus Paceibacterota bacterium]|jgi:hypothetical protein